MPGSYEEYKESTNKFTQWIIDKANQYLSITGKLFSNRISDYVPAVHQIISQQNKYCSGNNQLAQELPQILKYGKRAIYLRSVTHIHKSLEDEGKGNRRSAESRESDDRHLYVIGVLKACYKQLSTLQDSFSADNRSPHISPADLESPLMKSSFGRFEGLKEDLGGAMPNLTSVEEEVEALRILSDLKTLTIEDIDLHFGDLRLRILCFFLDWTSLLDQVEEAWKSVKKQEISVVAASVMTYTATRHIRSVDASLQLLYPTYVSFADFQLMVAGCMPKAEAQWIEDQPFYTLLAYIQLSLVNYIESCDDFDFENKKCYPVYPMELDKSYNERKEPLQYTLRDIGSFLSKELDKLYNAAVDCIQSSSRESFEKSISYLSIANDFIEPFLNFFITGNLTLSLIFTTACWIKSVQALEDKTSGFLGKSVYLCRYYQRSRGNSYLVHQQRIDKMLELLTNSKNIKSMNSCLKFRKQYLNHDHSLLPFIRYSLQQNNPYIAGGCLIDQIGVDNTFSTVVFEHVQGFHRSIMYLYKLFRTEGFIGEPIECLEAFLQVFEKCIFLQEGRTTPRCGEYLTDFLLCRGASLAEVKSIKTKGALPKKSEKGMRKVVKSIYPNNISKILKALGSNDFTQITTSLLTSDLLTEMIETTEYEIFDNRYLSMDLLIYFWSFYEFFETLVNKDPAWKTEYTQAVSELLLQKLKQDYSLTLLCAFDRSITIKCIKILDIPRENRDPRDIYLLQVVVDHMIDTFQKKYHEEQLERFYFSFPKTVEELYPIQFGDLNLSLPNEGGSEGVIGQEEYNTTLLLCVRAKASKDEDDKRKANAAVRDFVRTHASSTEVLEYARWSKGESGICSSFLGFYFLDDNLRDRDMAEWLFTMYGRVILPQFYENRIKNEEETTADFLRLVCRKGIAWVMDIVSTVCRREYFLIPDPITGNNCLHELALHGHYTLLHDMVSSLAIISWDVNKANQTFADYITDPNMKTLMEEYIEECKGMLRDQSQS